VHSVRSGDFRDGVIPNRGLNAWRLLWARLSHYASDVGGQSPGVNGAVAIIFPQAAR